MSDRPSHDPDTLADALLACPMDQRDGWIAAHRHTLSLEFLAALKRRSDRLLRTNPIGADDATCCALLVAQHMPEEPLALPLASWGRGNWEAYHDPQAAIRSYQQALAGYHAADDVLSMGRLCGNLVFVYADCGRFAEAQEAYRDARAMLVSLGEAALLYLLLLEQNYGWLLHNQGQYVQALAAHERALALADQINQPIIATEVQVNRALTYAMIGRLEEAETGLLRARAAAKVHAQPLTVARINMDLGELYAAQGQPAEALRWLQGAQEGFAALGNQMEAGSVLLRRAALFERIGALREARRSYAQAQAHFAALQMQPQVGIALLRGAAASRLDGAYARAAQLLEAADALWQALDQQLWRAEVLFERVELAIDRRDADAALALLEAPLAITDNPVIAVRRDTLLAEAQALRWRMSGDAADHAAARESFERAWSYARHSGDRWMQRRVQAGLGRLALPDDPERACHYLEAAAAHDNLMRQALSVEELKASFQAQASDLLPLLASLAVERAQPQQALSYIWRAKGSALLDLLCATDDQTRSTPSPAEIEQVRQQLAARRWQVAIEAGDAPLARPPDRRDETIRVLEQRLFDLRQQRNRLAAPGDMSLDAPADLLARMDADVLVEYLRCDDRLLAVRADRNGDCRTIWLGEVSAVLDLLDALQLSFQNVVIRSAEQRVQHHDAWLAECRPLLRRCYEQLIAPLGAFPPDAHLLLAPCDPLYLLPFAALWDGQHYLAQRCELQMTPSGALLAAPLAPSVTTEPLIVGASSEQRLGAVEREAAAIRSALPDCVFLLDDPRALQYLRSLEAAPRMLHFAAHSSLREDAPIFSALQLSGELLSVEQCYELPLSGTEVVTLSACATASGLDTGGSLLAFQSAFFIAGAHYVISSLWPVDDQMAAEWMGRFYRLLVAGLSPATALRRTQQTLLSEPATDHPAIWAAFICSCR